MGAVSQREWAGVIGLLVMWGGLACTGSGGSAAGAPDAQVEVDVAAEDVALDDPQVDEPVDDVVEVERPRFVGSWGGEGREPG